MSRGSKIVPVRIPAEILALLDCEIARISANPLSSGETRTSFILAAIREKLLHSARSRRKSLKLPNGYARDQHVHDVAGVLHHATQTNERAKGEDNAS